MFEKILIANRGEIALRVIRAAREMGIATVAVHSTADSDAMHVRMADESVCIGPPPSPQSYLSAASVIAACEITGADAVHPGYGFLSENARFAEILTEHGITFIGPTADHIRIMGDKIEAKKTAIDLGIPVVPGSDGAVETVDEARRLASDMGYPVLIAEDMPDIAAGSYSIAFGDFAAGYTVAERPDLRVLRDPFSAKPHVLFYATKRVGGDVSDFAAIKLMKFAVS